MSLGVKRSLRQSKEYSLEANAMKKFLDEDFMLSTEYAKKLFYGYAKNMPILDYHCHLSPQEIAQDRKFDNLTQLWLEGDHYKWRQMRANGIEERFITGDASDWEKFQKWAQTLEKAIGNPLYHWSHMELARFFGYHGVLNGKTAGEAWEFCSRKLRHGQLSARGLLRKAGVELLCTTDDPADSLTWHKKIAEDAGFDIKVRPTWRPDRAMQIGREDYLDYLALLSEASGVAIDSFQTLLFSLHIRMDAFAALGCRIADHGLGFVMHRPARKGEAEGIFQKRLSGGDLSAKRYAELHWVMQLHFGCRRDNNTAAFIKLGPDSGFDCIGDAAPISELAEFLNALEKTGQLPKTILYSLNPNDNAAVGTLLGCFQDSSAIGKIQQGSAWWFNDHKEGMRAQMTSLANLGLLGNFIGMLTDSRSFLSYARHEYFRRILCGLIGEWVESGEYPAEEEALGELVQNISYYNAARYFRF